MAKKVVIAPPSSAKKNARLRNSTYIGKENEEEDPVSESPVRSIFCLKKIEDMKRVEETEDCFILDFNPFDSIGIAKFTVVNDDDNVDLSIVAETDKVACRDYPHSRHLCLQFPFHTTPHDKHCDMIMKQFDR